MFQIFNKILRRLWVVFIVFPLFFTSSNLFGQVKYNYNRQDSTYWEHNAKREEPYGLGDDSKPHQGVPKGNVSRFYAGASKIYPGVNHDYWLYVPKQYSPSKPACLMVFTDGHAYLDKDVMANVVLDNLINSGEIPVIIGVFISAGDKGPGNPVYGGNDNRSLEYDAVNDKFDNFLIREIIPQVSKRYNITGNPSGRAIVGLSSGGICAFNAAWQRPDVFGKVISHCGSFVNIRGGDKFPETIRRSPKKNIKVYLQSAENDANLVWGYWPARNKEMAAALEYSGYDYKFEFAQDGGHSLKYGGAVLPGTLRWLWRDYKGDGL